MSCVVVGDGLAHDDSRFILVQATIPYVQSEVGRIYCLSPGTLERLGSYKLSSENGR
jgi:hypothetical protein